MHKQRIGWIGVGKMGAPMCGRLLDAGYRLTVLDPRPENIADLVDRGATAAVDPAVLAAESDVIGVTIPNDAALREAVLSAEHGLLKHLTSGHTLIEMSTVSPAVSAEVAEGLAQRGARYLRAPVSGSVALATAGKLSVLASGPADAYDACLPILNSFAARTVRLGDGEEARFMKIALNTMVAATAAFMSEAVAIARRGKVPMDLMLDVIGDSVVASPLIAYKRDLILEGRYGPQFSIDQMIKDLSLAVDVGTEADLDLPHLTLLSQTFAAAARAGKGDLDFFALVGSNSERPAGA